MAKPRISRSASAAPRSPATVEKRTNASVFLPMAEKTLALVYLVMSWVPVKVPKAPDPLACIRRSGITSRSKWASFSRNHTSCNNMGPRGPAVITFWLSATGAPALLVSFFFSDIRISFLVLILAFALLLPDQNIHGTGMRRILIYHIIAHVHCKELFNIWQR